MYVISLYDVNASRLDGQTFQGCCNGMFLSLR